MTTENKNAPQDAARLLDVIRTQTEIARLGLDLGGVMALVAERVQAMTGAVGSVVELAEGEDMVYRATAGIAEKHLGLRLKRAGSLSGRCVEIGDALRCDDTETDPRVDRIACRQIGLRSMIVVPLRHHESVVGALKVMGSAPNAFDDGDLQILDLLTRVDNRDGASSHATRLAQTIHRPFDYEQASLPLGASIGLAVYPDDGEDIAVLLEKADRDMYQAKRAKRGTR